MIRRCTGCGQSNRIPSKHLHETGRCGACKAPLPPSPAPIEIQDVATFDDLVANARVPILVDFWAAWCGPCRMVAPEVSRVAAQTTGNALVVKVDTEKLPQLAARYRVQGIPNFVVFRGGRLVRQQAGAMRAPDLTGMLDAA